MSMSSHEFYEDDKERWSEIDKIRGNVAKHLQIPPGSRVLDVLVGEGDFARAVCHSSTRTYVVAGEILASDLKEAKRRVEEDGLKNGIDLLKMDVTHMPFVGDSFDYVVNFLGWEDFTAVSGEELVNQFFEQILLVLKTNGVLAVTFTPELTAKDEISRKDIELREFTYKSKKRPKYFDEKFFLRRFDERGLRLVDKQVFATPKSRFLPQDAKNFLRWVSNNYKSYYAPDVEMRPYSEILRKYGQFINKHGLRETKSEFVVLIAEKRQT